GDVGVSKRGHRARLATERIAPCFVVSADELRRHDLHRAPPVKQHVFGEPDLAGGAATDRLLEDVDAVQERAGRRGGRTHVRKLGVLPAAARDLAAPSDLPYGAPCLATAWSSPSSCAPSPPSSVRTRSRPARWTVRSTAETCGRVSSWRCARGRPWRIRPT